MTRTAFRQLSRLNTLALMTLGKDWDATVADDNRRRRACSEVVVKKYRPVPGGPLESAHRREYLSACFQRPEELSPASAATLRTVTARLDVPALSEICTAVILSQRVALTARHCFLDRSEPVSTSIPLDRVLGAKLEGTDAAGTPWTIKGLRVYADAFAAGSSLHAKFAKAPALRQPEPTRDFIAVAPALPEVTFGMPAPVSPVSPELVRGTIRMHQRLLLASYPYGERTLLVDAMSSCVVMTYTPEAGYFKHHCQALEGSSGAPVFLFSPGPPHVILGLHAGREGSFGDPRTLEENEAVFLPQELIDELRERGDIPTTPLELAGHSSTPLPAATRAVRGRQ